MSPNQDRNKMLAMELLEDRITPSAFYWGDCDLDGDIDDDFNDDRSASSRVV